MESKVAGVTDVTSGASRRDVPLMEVSLDLAQGMAIKTDRCVGDVPVLEVIDWTPVSGPLPVRVLRGC